MTAPNSRCLALMNRIARPQGLDQQARCEARGRGIVIERPLLWAGWTLLAQSVAIDSLGHPRSPMWRVGIGTETFRKTVP